MNIRFACVLGGAVLVAGHAFALDGLNPRLTGFSQPGLLSAPPAHPALPALPAPPAAPSVAPSLAAASDPGAPAPSIDANGSTLLAQLLGLYR